MADMIEKMRAKRIWVPENAREIRIKPLANINFVVYAYNDWNGRPCVQMYRRNALKPLCMYYYPNEEKRTERVKEIVAGYIKEEESKQARRKKTSAGANDIKIGDVFYSSWGYDQTNVDYYEVVGTAGKTTFLLKEIAMQRVGESRCVPVPGEYVKDEVLRKRWNGNSFKISDCQWAYPAKCETVGDIKAFESHYVTPAGMGH